MAQCLREERDKYEPSSAIIGPKEKCGTVLLSAAPLQKTLKNKMKMISEGMTMAINELFDRRIEHQRIKKFGEQSKIRTAIREEPIKLAQYLRGEKRDYEPIWDSTRGFLQWAPNTRRL